MNIKKNLNSLISENKYFFIGYLFFLILGASILIFLKKDMFLVWLNYQHNPILDFIFFYATILGDGNFFVVMLIPLAIIKLRHCLIGVFSYATGGIITQIIKKLADVDRPYIFYQNKMSLYFVPGVDINIFYSFPSGHSATAFTLCLIFAMLTPNKKIGSLYLLLAVIISLSRVYLLQHFFIDIYFGSLIGVFFAVAMALLIKSIKRLNDSALLDKSLLSLIRLKKKK